MNNKLYITTTLPYVNAEPHIGHALELVQADAISRYFRAKLGNENVTVQNLDVVKVDAEKNLILIRGAVPGPKGGYVLIKDSVKAGK